MHFPAAMRLWTQNYRSNTNERLVLAPVGTVYTERMGCIMKMHRAIPRYGQFGLALCLILLGWHAHAQDKASADLHMRANAAMCANCHGSEGRTVSLQSLWAAARHMGRFASVITVPVRTRTGRCNPQVAAKSASIGLVRLVFVVEASSDARPRNNGQSDATADTKDKQQNPDA